VLSQASPQSRAGYEKRLVSVHVSPAIRSRFVSNPEISHARDLEALALFSCKQLVGNFVADVLLAWSDPRIRLKE